MPKAGISTICSRVSSGTCKLLSSAVIVRRYFLQCSFPRSYAPIKSKLQHPPPPGKPRAFDHFLCPGGGEFDLQGVPGGGDLTFAWVWWGTLDRKCRFFFSGAEVANVFRRDGIN